jgi:hypothetical protein
MARWTRGEQAVQFLIDRDRLESFEAENLTALTDALIVRTARRVETTATAALRCRSSHREAAARAATLKPSDLRPDRDSNAGPAA